MASEMSIQDRLSLITRGIPPLNVHGINAIRTALENPGRTPKCLWVTSPTGKPHVGYYVPLLKFADLIKAGCEIIVVLLDVYSFLDNVKYPMDQVRQRMFYYKYIVIGALKSLGIPTTKIRFVEESSYHFSREWIIDQWRLCTLVPQQAVKDAWDRSYNPDLLSPMFCPGIQTLAEEHLDVDFQFGGEDQQGIFSFAERFLPQLGYRVRGHIMNPMIPNLHGTKMSSSHPGKTKIMFLDDHQAVEQKVKDAPWNGLDSSKTGVLSVLRNVLIPAAELRQENWDNAQKSDSHTNGENNGPVNGLTNGHTNGQTNGLTNGHTNGLTNGHTNGIVKGNTNGVSNGQKSTYVNGSKPRVLDSLFTVEKSGETLHFNSYEDVEQSVTEGTIGPDDIKAAVARGLNDLLEPVRQMYKETPEWQTLDLLAYPDDSQK